MKILKTLALATTLACTTMGAQAGIINGDFSDGLNGWDVSLSANGQAGVFNEQLYLTSDASISQGLSWLMGDEISFDYLLDFTEEQNATLPFADFALFWVTDVYDTIVTQITIGDLFNNSSTEENFTYVFESTETGSFHIGIFDLFDNARNSRMRIDNVTFEGGTPTVDVPAPATLGLFSLALLFITTRKKLIS